MSAALDLLERVPNVLIFLTALTVVAECCAVAGVFDSFGDKVVHWSSGHVGVIWSAMCLVAVVVTAFLSLDTTAVLLTPVALALARRTRRRPAAFVFPVLWIANMGSLWLPVSNLTNLLARHTLGTSSATAFLAHTWPVALTATLVPLLCAMALWGNDLRGRIDPTVPDDPHNPCLPDSTLRRWTAVVVIAMCVTILVVEPAWATTLAATLCVVLVGVFAPRRLREIALPWRSILVTAGLFVAVALLHGTGLLDPLLSRLESSPVWMTAIVGGIAANVVNNLPAYLAVEPAATSPTAVTALLIGVNVASGVTLWGSVATLLWRDRLRRDGDHARLLTWRTHLRLTGTVTAVTTAACLVVAAWR